MNNINNKIKNKFERLITEFGIRRGYGNTTALFGKSDKKPIYIIWSRKEKLLVNKSDLENFQLQSIKSFPDECKGMSNPIVIDISVVSDLLKESLEAFTKYENKIEEDSSKIRNLEKSCKFFSEDLTILRKEIYNLNDNIIKEINKNSELLLKFDDLEKSFFNRLKFLLFKKY